VTDRIRIEELRLRAVIGVREDERERPQEIRVSLVLELDLTRPAQTDALDDAVDYAAVADDVAAHVERSRYHLVERLAGAVADLVLERHPTVRAVDVRVEKPGAVPRARTVAVELRRERA